MYILLNLNLCILFWVQFKWYFNLISIFHCSLLIHREVINFLSFDNVYMLIITSKTFIFDSLGFSTQMIMTFMNDSFISSCIVCMPFIYFYYIIALKRIINMMLNRMIKKNISFFLILGRKHSVCRFLQIFFNKFSKFTSIPSFWEFVFSKSLICEILFLY